MKATATDFVYRLPWPDEEARARRLFGVPNIPLLPTQLVVAVKRTPVERLVGCAAVCRTIPREQGLVPDYRFHWRMQPHYAGGNVEAELIAETIRVAGQMGAAKLSTQSFLSRDEKAASVLARLGFKAEESVEEYEAPFDAARTRSQRILRTLQARGSIPSRARVVAIHDAPIEEVRARLHAEGIMDVFDFDQRMVAGAPEPIDGERSPVIMVDGEVVGVIVSVSLDNGKVLYVPGRWVAPEYRKGWANAVLIARVTSTEGPESVRFAANSAWHEETMRFSRRLGGHAVASRSRFAVDCPRGQLLEGPSPAMNAGGAA